MFVGVVVENFHKCRENQEREEKARRAAKHSKKLERKRKSKLAHLLAYLHTDLITHSLIVCYLCSHLHWLVESSNRV